MIKISHIPLEIKKLVKSNLKLLDDNYGVDRKLYDDGGVVIIIETMDDFKKINELFNFKSDKPYEYKDLVTIKNSKIAYTIELYLISTEYGLILIKELYRYE